MARKLTETEERALVESLRQQPGTSEREAAWADLRRRRDTEFTFSTELQEKLEPHRVERLPLL